MKTTFSHPRKPKSTNRNLIIIACAIAVVLIGIFLVLDLPPRQRYAVVDHEVEKVRSDVMNPGGAEEWTKSADLRGNGLISTLGCWPDVHCPVIGRTWYVPITPGKEGELFTTILKTEGYTITEDLRQDCAPSQYGERCKATGWKDKLQMRVGLVSTGGTTPPNKDVAPKVWRFVNIEVNYFWGSK